MAYKMQASVPELTAFSAVFVITVPKHVLESYGPDVTRQGSFAYNCLMARRLVERGVRFVQCVGWPPSAVCSGSRNGEPQDGRGRPSYGDEFGSTPFCQGEQEQSVPSEMARRFLDEIRANPKYWTDRLHGMARSLSS